MSSKQMIPVSLLWEKLKLQGLYHPVENATTCVVLFHGFTGSKEEVFHHFTRISESLQSQGIASLRFDYGGHGQSDGTFAHLTMEDWLAHLDTMVAFAKSLPYQSLIALGFSMSGYLLLKRRHPHFSKTILINPAVNMRDILERIRKQAILNDEGLWQQGSLCLSSALIESFTADLEATDIVIEHPYLVLQCADDEVVSTSSVHSLFGSHPLVHLQWLSCDHIIQEETRFSDMLDAILGFCA
jgi:esterase/lipase